MLAALLLLGGLYASSGYRSLSWRPGSAVGAAAKAGGKGGPGRRRRAPEVQEDAELTAREVEQIALALSTSEALGGSMEEDLAARDRLTLLGEGDAGQLAADAARDQARRERVAEAKVVVDADSKGWELSRVLAAHHVSSGGAELAAVQRLKTDKARRLAATRGFELDEIERAVVEVLPKSRGRKKAVLVEPVEPAELVEPLEGEAEEPEPLAAEVVRAAVEEPAEPAPKKTTKRKAKVEATEASVAAEPKAAVAPAAVAPKGVAPLYAAVLAGVSGLQLKTDARPQTTYMMFSALARPSVKEAHPEFKSSEIMSVSGFSRARFLRILI